MRLRPGALAFGVASLLGACAEVPYAPPKGGATATLVIENGNVEGLEAAAYADGNACSGKQAIHPGVRYGAPHTIAIPAGGLFTLWTRGDVMMLGARPGTMQARVCRGAISFNVMPGRRYVASFRVTGNESYCDSLTFEEVRFANGTSRRTPIPHRVRQEPACK